MLDLPLPAHGFFFGLESLIIGEYDGKAGPGVFGSLTGVMSQKPAVKIGGPAGVKSIITAPQDISVIRIHSIYHIKGTAAADLFRI